MKIKSMISLNRTGCQWSQPINPIEYKKAGYDGVASFIQSNSPAILRAISLADLSTPPIVRSCPKYRFLIPDWVNAALAEEFSQEILQIVEHQCESHDLNLLGKRISVKTVCSGPDVFPRPKKRGCGLTKGQYIQLKNTKESIVLNGDEFDYLAIIIMKEYHGLYLLSFDQVLSMLSNGLKHGCDENGFDGKGQIRVYPNGKEECLACVEATEAEVKANRQKYGYSNVLGETRTADFLNAMYNHVIKPQIKTTKGGNNV